jgi:hypothetical protein
MISLGARKFERRQMKIVLKALLLLASLSLSIQTTAQTAFRTKKSSAEAGDTMAQVDLRFSVIFEKIGLNPQSYSHVNRSGS